MRLQRNADAIVQAKSPGALEQKSKQARYLVTDFREAIRWRRKMPILLWLLGVPVVVIIALMLTHVI